MIKSSLFHRDELNVCFLAVARAYVGLAFDNEDSIVDQACGLF